MGVFFEQAVACAIPSALRLILSTFFLGEDVFEDDPF